MNDRRSRPRRCTHSAEPTQTVNPDVLRESLTNPDFFLHTDPYAEPTYEKRLQCGDFDWVNAANAEPGSVVADTVGAVCIIVGVHRHDDGTRKLSSCTGTLIGPDLVLTASHCANDPDDLKIRSGSVCFGFQTTREGGRPAGYAPTFHKIRRIVRRGAADWMILQIDTPPGGLGITPRTLRSAGPIAGEKVFTVHHPNGAVKKLQQRTLTTASVTPAEDFDYAGGSSGSALFDAAGRLLGAALSVEESPCRVHYVPASTVLQELANPPAPPAPWDVMLVIDRSGSMSAPGTSGPGRTKMDEARDAASLFVRLVRIGFGDRVGMVSFSTSATRPADSALGAVDTAKKNELVGPLPYTSGAVGRLAAGGATSIGDGLAVAISTFGAPSTNQRAILLLTDGLQNTPPMVEAVAGGLGATRLFAVGFGAEGDLDGPLLTRVARDHGGLYTRAGEGLTLKKFFSLAFGGIFEDGALVDPAQPVVSAVSAEKYETAPTSFQVCEEDRITVVLGWDSPTQRLQVSLRTPAGITVTAASTGVEGDRGQTWQFLRVPLPFGGERAGTWRWKVSRVAPGPEAKQEEEEEEEEELAPNPEDVRFFVTVIAAGGPLLAPLPPTTRIYTGDQLNPLVSFLNPNGTAPPAKITLEIEAPDAALGTIVTEAGLEEPTVDSDPLSAFRATLRKLGAATGGFNLPVRTHTVELVDDGAHRDGAMEPDGVYGHPLADLTRYEGTYAFHARADYGDSCGGSREARWSLYVELGIDPSRTDVAVTAITPTPGGDRSGTIVVTPRDRHGSPLGPGRADTLHVSGTTGTTTHGPVRDNRDGSYSVDVTWDPDIATLPGLVLTQPERPAVPLTPAGAHPVCPQWLWGLLAATLVLVVLLIVIIIVLAVV